MCKTVVVTALSCVLTLLVARESFTSPIGKCIQNGDLLADDQNCAVYWVCLENGAMPFHCPGKLLFNGNLHVCTHPDEADCHVGIPHDNGVCWAAEACPLGAKGWSVPHAGSCKAYCRCDDHGVPRTRRCPEGQHFCSERRTCVDVSVARCRLRLLGDCPMDLNCPAALTDTAYTLPHPRDCSSFCLCVDGRPSLQRCPQGSFFSRGKMTCVKENPPEYTTEEVCPAVGSCPQEGSLHLPHADDCTLFCRCDHGVPRLDRCPAGLFFDPTLQNCDWPWRARCNTSALQSKKIERCPTNGTCPFPDPLNYTVHLPHAFNCSLYCRCDHGNPKEESCPAGLHFNPILQVCDRPHVAGCLKHNPKNLQEHHLDDKNWNHCTPIGKCPSSGTGRLPHATNCSLYCSCHDGKSRLERCPPGLHFSPSSKVCEWPVISGCEVPTLDNGDASECPPIGSCPESEFVGTLELLPHQRSCSFFCKCSGGKPYLHRCPTGLHFSPTRKVCEWPIQAGCNFHFNTW